MTSQTLKTGTRIEVIGFDVLGNWTFEPAIIARAVASQVRPSGYHLVRFADGGKLCVHETRFRVTDNRA